MINCKKIDNDDLRIKALPKNFKNHFIKVENTIYSYADYLIDGYNGGFWDFFETDNGGFFMSPRMGEVKMSFPNMFEMKVSGNIVGIICCLYSYCHLHGKYQIDSFAEHYHLLLDYAKTLPPDDYDKIVQALD